MAASNRRQVACLRGARFLHAERDLVAISVHVDKHSSIQGSGPGRRSMQLFLFHELGKGWLGPSKHSAF